MPEKRNYILRADEVPFPKQGEEVVISGIAGRFPHSDNLKHLRDNLFNKVDLITEDERRWKKGNPDVPQRVGKVNNLEKFDARFFGIKPNEADGMDPMARMLLEHAYEAIIDAGVNPQQLRGTNTGVFIGTCSSESEKTFMYEGQLDGIGLLGCSRFMMTNRISQWLGCTGPSYTCDTACSSSLFAMDHAYRAIRRGDCDAALVGGCNLCLHPSVSRQFFLLGVLSPEGRCRSFDADGHGYCRSEAVSVIYMQKSKDARRIYANVVHTKTNSDGYKEEGITFPSGTMQTALLKKFYEECKVAPSDVAFVEAHGTGTKVGDPVEVNALDEVFHPSIETPLRIGSIKSNLGHSEPASGLCSIAKVIIAMESGLVPPNLHYNRPRDEIEALLDGRIQVITELTPWKGGYVGINSFGFGGANAHVLLKSNPKEKINHSTPGDVLPRLVVVSGRTEDAVMTLLRNLGSIPVDAEYVSLFHNIHNEEIPNHPYRGYTILPPHGLPEKCVSDVQRYYGAKRPVWFVFSGLGSQWAGMGKALLTIPVFEQAIKHCADALRPYNLDIVDILTNIDLNIEDNILHSLVGIIAVQIGLVDVMSALGIMPDKIIGYSVGELSCAYADGCLTAEQTILSAYYTGLALVETQTVSGSMATVGLGKSKLAKVCPTEIDIVCYNSPERTVISGSVESIDKFLTTLRTAGIFAQKESCAKIAYHSRYVSKTAPRLIKYLRKVIPNPKFRSKKWISTSVSRDKQEVHAAQLCSPDYYLNNLVSPVLFAAVCPLISHDALTIEIAPRSLLETTLRSSLQKDNNYIPLIENKNENTVEVLLQAIGKMYEMGLHPQLINLYPSISYPVSRGTPMISPLIQWEHSLDWLVNSFVRGCKLDVGERSIRVVLTDCEIEYMSGHIIDGRNLLPATGYLAFVWETVGMMQGVRFSELPVTFQDVRFHRATTIPKEGSVTLKVMVHKGTGRFEIVEGDTTVVNGFVHALSDSTVERSNIQTSTNDNIELDLTSKDIYKELRLRGYHYTGLFRGLRAASSNGLKGRIAWEGNWVAFMDNMLQLQLLSTDTRGLFVPTGIRKLVIDPLVHTKDLNSISEEKKDLLVEFYKNLGIVVSGGIQIQGLKANAIARKRPATNPVLEHFKFVAHRDRAEMELMTIIRLATHIALENYSSTKIKTIEFVDDQDNISAENLTSLMIQKILADLPLLHADVHIVASTDKFSSDTLPSDINISDSTKLSAESDTLLAVTHGISTKEDVKTVMQLQKALVTGGFLLATESLNADINKIVSSDSFDVILEKSTREGLVILFRKREKLPEISTVISLSNYKFDWVSKMQDVLNTGCQSQRRNTGRILLVSEDDCENGLMGLLNCLRREPGGQNVQGLLIQDLQAPRFSLKNAFYSEQLKLGLALNVLRPGRVWGTYRFFAMDPLPLQPVYHARISQLVPGDLSTMTWVDGGIQSNTPSKDIVKIHYSSINFRDVMLGTGKLAVEVVAKTRQSQANVLGFEFSGRDINGCAVMGMIESGTLSNLCICDEELLWRVPDNWTLEDAATVPTVYGTAYYALYLSGEMKKGDKVLIHAGSGGVGQAAITLALHEGCEVFTTVGTAQKREFIKNQFPQIDDDHIGNSRDTSFEQLIFRKTCGQGVDIVLNSLSEEKLQASVRCLALGGRFLEIGKFDLAANNLLAMEHFSKGIRFHGILLDNLFTASRGKKREMASMLTKGLRSGAIKPLVRTVFHMDQVEAAFRYMAAGKHIGKVIIKIRDESESCQSPQPLALPRYYCSDDGSYLILGGLGGFGLELADWLVLRGARKLVLTSRKGIANGYQRLRINIWKSYGVRVVVVTGKDASIREDCQAILDEARALGPVEAIFNLAVVLKDALFENQTVDSFEESLRVKAWATKQLDVLSRTMCPRLKHFVVFSSVSCGRGNAGQTNYGMANSIMERICEARAMENLPGLAIQWGAIGDVGLVAEMQEENRQVVIGGTLQQGIVSCLQELDGFLQQNFPVVSSMVVAEKLTGGAGAANIVDTVVKLMGLKDLKTISLQTPLAELGMDSMMGVEIKQLLEREFEVFLTAADIRNLTFAKLQEISTRLESENDISHNKDDSEMRDLAGIGILDTLGTKQSNEDICVPIKSNVDDKEEVFILPGIEGSYTVFESLANKLNSPTTCLQFPAHLVNLTSVDDMANYLIPHIKARNKDRQNFTIVGYSFGSLIAIELVRLLEREGWSGRLVLIDGSPDYMKSMLTQQFGNVSDNELQSKVLLGILRIFVPHVDKTFVDELENCKSWDEKLAACTKNVARDEILDFTTEEQHAICSSIYCRIKACQTYECSALPPLRTPIILIKPTIESVHGMSEDYGLRLITREKVEVHYAQGNHLTMLDDDICVAAIDGELIQS